MHICETSRSITSSAQIGKAAARLLTTRKVKCKILLPLSPRSRSPTLRQCTSQGLGYHCFDGNCNRRRYRRNADPNSSWRYPVKGAALIVACAQGQLPSIKFLFRQGAKVECTSNSRVITALEAAMGNHEVTRWFLVDRFTDQYKLTGTPFNSDKHVGTRHWSGVRQVQIPLQGKYERPMETSLMEHAR